MEKNELETLVRKTTEGDMVAFEKLYQMTNQRVYFICLNFLKNEQDAEDAVQDTYLIAFKNIRQLSEPQKFRTWVERIAVNRCKDIIKKNQPVPVDDDILNETLLAEDEFAIPEKYIIDKEKRRILMDIMRTKLTDLQYQAILLYYFNNLSIAEIAEIMECSEGAVKNRLSKARAAIKRAIDEFQKDKDDKLFTFVGVPFLAKVFDEESKILTAPALNTSMLTSQAVSSQVVSSQAVSGAAKTAISETVKTGGKIISKKVLAGILAGVVATGGVTTAVIISANSQKTEIQTENSVVDSVSRNTSDSSAVSQEESQNSSVQNESSAESSASGKIIKTGKCGDNAFYSITEDGVLTISGTGDIYDYSKEEGNISPWRYDQAPDYRTIVIEDGITRIGNYAFSFSRAYEITIPDSVTEIGEYALSNISSCETINLPDSIVKIEEGAFAYSEFNSLTIPKNVKEIPAKMCTSSFNLKEITIPDGVEKIGESAFDFCELINVKLPDTLTEIDAYAFEFCSGIKELTIPASVNKIGVSAFFKWGNDQTIYIEGKTNENDFEPDYNVLDYWFGNITQESSELNDYPKVVWGGKASRQ